MYRKLDREAEALQREEIKALLQNKKASTKRYEESLKNYSPSDDEADREINDPSPSSSQITVASIANSLLTAKTLEDVRPTYPGPTPGYRVSSASTCR